MIPFHLLYSWLFKSFRISGETELIDRLITEWTQNIMVVKRSWIFWIFILWMPMIILSLSWVSIFIAIYSIKVEFIKNTIIAGNILISLILIVSSIRYIIHFREIHGNTEISTDIHKLRSNLNLWDIYFIRFFNWSITNQIVLFLTIIIELSLVFIYQNQLWDHIWILTIDTGIMILEMIFLRLYRKRMIDLEMDYNVIIPGKIFFVNQSWVLSSIQSIEGDKIKTVRSLFPSKIASFFNYWTVDILTEGDDVAMIWTMSMYYVTNPDNIVTNIQSLLDNDYRTPREWKRQSKTVHAKLHSSFGVKEHSYDTRSKIRDVLQ